jgi:hypothetical protein
MTVNKFVVILAVMALAAAGCQKKEETPPQPAPPHAEMPPAQMPSAASPHGDMPPGNPHEGMKPVEIPAGAGHKGTVLEAIKASGYTYVQVEEKGQKLWVAMLETDVKPGDIVEFPDSAPMLNFKSRALNKTFDKVYFAPGLRISKK